MSALPGDDRCVSKLLQDPAGMRSASALLRLAAESCRQISRDLLAGHGASPRTLTPVVRELDHVCQDLMGLASHLTSLAQAVEEADDRPAPGRGRFPKPNAPS
jgi:hypothetical protein